ncbi:cytochrome c3 family protein [Planctomycetota bacterium]
MKGKYLKCMLVSSVIVAMIGGPLFAAITGSAHDFSGEAWSSGEICLPCHTAHNADTSLTDAPLWNHEVTIATFTVYSSTTLDAGALGQPAGTSKLCLSCHDGTVALENFGGATGGTNVVIAGLVGTDLSNDHPISFTYDDTLAGNDGELFLPSTDTTILGGTIDDDLLFEGKLECASCHDVHGTSVDGLLRMSNEASALCLTCHNK